MFNVLDGCTCSNVGFAVRTHDKRAAKCANLDPLPTVPLKRTGEEAASCNMLFISVSFGSPTTTWLLLQYESCSQLVPTSSPECT